MLDNDNFPSLFLIEVDLYFFAVAQSAKNKIYTNLLGANMVQKSANEEEIKGKNGKYRICILVYIGL